MVCHMSVNNRWRLFLAFISFADASGVGYNGSAVKHHHKHHHHHHHHAEPAVDAKSAADDAKQAASVANKVAAHSVKITHHAQAALKNAKNALRDARVDTTGLSEAQRDYLKAAEENLRTATQDAKYGKLSSKEKLEQKLSDTDDSRENQKLRKLQQELEAKEGRDSGSESARMRGEVRRLRGEIKQKRERAERENGGEQEKSEKMKDLEKELADIETDMEVVEERRARGEKKPEGSPSTDEMKAEIERLREAIKRAEAEESGGSRRGAGRSGRYVQGSGGDNVWIPRGGAGRGQSVVGGSSGSVDYKGFDVDTEMPYGELEPFGREDTAQELTESSIRESDEMVDQLERAEVAEEKRSVFRALTRLRGAAITSYDGIARAQTGNIDEYNKTHKWRKTHPLHHLADEESDISKWAFPDNADF